jgi:hypothetical protein
LATQYGDGGVQGIVGVDLLTIAEVIFRLNVLKKRSKKGGKYRASSVLIFWR